MNNKDKQDIIKTGDLAEFTMLNNIVQIVLFLRLKIYFKAGTLTKLIIISMVESTLKKQYKNNKENIIKCGFAILFKMVVLFLFWYEKIAYKCIKINGA